jgi:NH3-dependent NAD+ synthetase
MRKLMLAAAMCLALPGCATLTEAPTAPLAQTHIDEQALTAAYASFDVVLMRYISHSQSPTRSSALSKRA